MSQEFDIYEPPQAIDVGGRTDTRGVPVVVMAVVAAGFYLVVGATVSGLATVNVGGAVNVLAVGNTVAIAYD